MLFDDMIKIDLGENVILKKTIYVGYKKIDELSSLEKMIFRYWHELEGYSMADAYNMAKTYFGG